MYHQKKFAYKIILFFFILFQIGSTFLLSSLHPVYAASPFQRAYTTLGNSRFSFRGAINTGISTGASLVTIKSSGNPDNDVGNLFPEDILCLNGSGGVGCKNNVNYSVTNNPDVAGQVVLFSPAISGSMNDSDRVISTQSGTLIVTFRPTNGLVSNDKLVFTIPAAATSYNDGIPDSNGFDSAALPANLLAGVCAANVCFTPTSFTASAVTLSSTTSLHTVTITVSSTLDTVTDYSFSLGHASDARYRFLNPAPAGTSHTRGISDSLSAELKSQNSAQTITYDDTIIKMNPIDGVFVSATVEEALTYKINEASQGHVNGSGSVPASTPVTECNGGTFTTSVASTPTSVPYGSITSYDTFYRAAQEIYVQTNTKNGFVVTVQYNNALKTAGGASTIADGTCDGTCNADTAAAWGTASNNGFGYTLGNIAGAEAAWTGATFKIFSSTAKTIMTKSSQTSGSRVAVCYLFSVDSTQVAGYYFNKLTYIATPKF